MSSQSPSVQSYEVDDRALIIHTGTGLLVITPWSARTVRIRYRLGTELSRQASLAVVADDEQRDTASRSPSRTERTSSYSRRMR